MSGPGARALVLIGLSLAALLITTVALPAVRVGGWRPDVVVATVVAVALADGADSGLRMGFGLGLAQDLLGASEGLVGLWALVLLVIGYVTGRARPYTAAGGLPARMAVTGIAAGVALLGYGLLGKGLDVTAISWGRLVTGALVTALYTGLVSPAVLYPVTAAVRRVPPESAAV